MRQVPWRVAVMEGLINPLGRGGPLFHYNRSGRESIACVGIPADAAPRNA
jgi:hypothetical protein